jgi:hypothetical protein
MSMEIYGGMILAGENRRIRRKPCRSSTLSTTNATDANPDLHGERPVTNRLSHVIVGGLVVTYLPLGPRFAGSHPDEAMYLKGEKTVTRLPSEGQ